MNKINKINVCCQKVLPLVYDESLSYYEVLCKVIQKLNELIKINNNIRDEVHSDYLAVLEGAKVATEAVASVTSMRDEVLTLKQATEQYAHDVVTVYNQTVEARDTAIAKANIAEQSATTATEKANIAQVSATTATEKANIAVQSATTATQKANSAQQSATVATEKANIATEKADKVLNSMSLVSGTVNYYKSDEIAIMVDEDGTYAYTTPYIRNNVLYINVRLEYTLYGPLTIKLPNLTKKTINFTPVITWATSVIENIDLSNLPHTVFTGGGVPIIDGVQFITACVSSYRSFPTYVVGLQMFSNEKTQIALESGKSITIPYYFTLIQPLVFTDEVTPDPTDYITKLNEETQAREQADTQLQNNINTEKTARENADAQLQTNIDTLSNDVFHKNQVVPIANGGTGASDVVSARKELMSPSYVTRKITAVNENFTINDNIKFFNGGIYFWGLFDVISNIETTETEFATFDLNTIGWKCKDFSPASLNQFNDGSYLRIRCKNNILHFEKSNGIKKGLNRLSDKYPIIFLN